jgi:competence protein ComEC
MEAFMPNQTFSTTERFAGRTLPATLHSWTKARLPTFRRFMRWAVTLLGISFCIQVALMPLTVRAFGVAALCFHLNLLWLPALGFLVMPPAFAGLLLSGLGLELPAQAALYLASLPCAVLMDLLSWLDGTGLLLAPIMPRPHWLSIAGFWLLCLTLPALILGRGGTRRGTIVFVLAGLVLFALPPALALYADSRPGVRLRLLDVGQGQAVLVEWSGLSGHGSKNGNPSGRALIDGGGFASDTFDVGKNIIAPILTDNALPRLDLVVNTHPDTDHLAGLIYILEHFTVRQYLSNGVIKYLADEAEFTINRIH